MEKSSLLGNGYSQPPTHLNPMQFMALNHAAQQAAAAAAAQHALLTSPGSNALGQAGLPTGLSGLGAPGSHPSLGAGQGSEPARFGNPNGSSGSAGHGGPRGPRGPRGRLPGPARAPPRATALCRSVEPKPTSSKRLTRPATAPFTATPLRRLGEQGK